MRTLLLCVALALPFVAAAEDRGAPGDAPPAPNTTTKVVYEKDAKISFEDDLVEGSLKGPDAGNIQADVRTTHSNLIKIRETWREKVLESSGEL